MAANYAAKLKTLHKESLGVGCSARELQLTLNKLNQTNNVSDSISNSTPDFLVQKRRKILLLIFFGVIPLEL